MTLCYNETVTFVKVRSDGYGNTKVVTEQGCVPCMFLQGTGFLRTNYQENTTADATCFVDPMDDFIVDNHYRLEGMYVLAPLFDVDDDEGWYLVTNITINRDHLLANQIDNVEVLLKKTRRPYGFS